MVPVWYRFQNQIDSWNALIYQTYKKWTGIENSTIPIPLIDNVLTYFYSDSIKPGFLLAGWKDGLYWKVFEGQPAI